MGFVCIGVVFDVRTKKHVRTIRRWSGQVTKDGRLGLYAPSRGGLELVHLKDTLLSIWI